MEELKLEILRGWKSHVALERKAAYNAHRSAAKPRLACGHAPRHSIVSKIHTILNYYNSIDTLPTSARMKFWPISDLQSRSSSLMLVFDLVCASTFFTITAQYKLTPFLDGKDPATTTDPEGTSP